MSEKFLIIANKPISGAIVSTLSLLNSYHFVQINSLEFPDLETLVDNLEGLKDDKSINAIMQVGGSYERPLFNKEEGFCGFPKRQ